MIRSSSAARTIDPTAEVLAILQELRDTEAARLEEFERIGTMSVDLVAYLKGVGSALGTEKLVAWPQGEAPELKREANERRRSMTTRRPPAPERSRSEQGLRATA